MLLWFRHSSDFNFYNFRFRTFKYLIVWLWILNLHSSSLKKEHNVAYAEVQKFTILSCAFIIPKLLSQDFLKVLIHALTYFLQSFLLSVSQFLAKYSIKRQKFKLQTTSPNVVWRPRVWNVHSQVRKVHDGRAPHHNDHNRYKCLRCLLRHHSIPGLHGKI